ncbi:hypothetical protein DFH29DRAFT_970514 [Suillus ampliporus]|nr:hypothetical protein DFH29DRAFT_970514 [Suillus ampliporus]
MRILPVFMTVSLIPTSGKFKCHYFLDLDKIQWCFYLSLGCATLSSFLIAGSMCYLLVTSNTKTDITLRTLARRHDQYRMLDELAAMPDNFIYLGFEFLLSKLYVNSYFALLNARYYHDGNAHISQRRPPHVYRPELQVNVSQDGSPRTSEADKFQVFQNHPIAVVVEMESFSM